jgi:hypothetical protein
MADEVLALRVIAVEQEVEGEKIVPRHILEQTRRNGADIATMKVDIGVLKSDIATLKADVAILKSDVTAIKPTCGHSAPRSTRIRPISRPSWPIRCARFCASGTGRPGSRVGLSRAG